MLKTSNFLRFSYSEDDIYPPIVASKVGKALQKPVSRFISVQEFAAVVL